MRGAWSVARVTPSRPGELGYKASNRPFLA